MKKLICCFFTICLLLIFLAACDFSSENSINSCKHNFEYEIVQNATCTAKGRELGICSICKMKNVREIPALVHDMKNVAAKAATCIEDGWNEYEMCLRCGESTFETISALGHNIEHFEAKLPTESSVGWNDYDACNRCDWSTYEEIPKTDRHIHAFGEWQTFADSTCTAEGTKIRYCIDKNCGGEETGVIPALGHDIEAHEGKAPTPDAGGWTEYTVCKRCDEMFGYKELEKVTYYEAYADGRIVYEDYSAVWNRTNGLGTDSTVGGTSVVIRPGGIIVPEQANDKYPGLWLETVENSNKLMKYVSAPNGSGEFNKTILIQPVGGFEKGAKYIFETDIYFSKAAASVGGVQGKTFATFSFETVGATSTSTSSTRMKVSMIKGNLDNYMVFGKTVKADTWINITIEYDYATGIATTMINGEEAESYELKEKVDVKYIGFSMNNTLKGAYTMFDTTYLGSFGEQPEDTELVGSNDENSEILSVKGGANGIVVLVHDDGTLSSAKILDALYEKYGLHGDVAMVADRVDPANSALDSDRLAWQALIETGRWGVLNHSMTHTYWGNTSTGALDQSLITKEFITSGEVLRDAFPTERILVYAYPGMSAVTNTFGESVYDEVKKVVAANYLAGRWYSGGSSSLYNWDWEFMPTQGVDTKPESNASKIDYVAENGGFISILMHKVLDDTDPNANKDTSNISASVAEALCAKIAEYVNQGVLWSANYDDAVLYLMEAEKAYLEVTRNETSITATLEDGLDDELYNYPLSVRIGVPENWKTVRYVVSGNEYLTEAKSIDGKNVIDIDLLPNGATVTITVAIDENETSLVSSFAETLSDGSTLDKNYYPGFVRKAVTFTIDDGNISYDSEFLNIIRPVGIVGTFNLIDTNSVTAVEYLKMYEGYEVANHNSIHSLPWLDGIDFSNIEIKNEIFNSQTADPKYMYKTNIEGLYYIDYYTHIVPSDKEPSWHPIAIDSTYTKYAEMTKENIDSVFGDGSVVGYAYAHGKLSESVKQYLIDEKYLYARKTGYNTDTTFALPKDRFEWTYNADVSNLNSTMASYASLSDNGELKMFAFGVHSKDFTATVEGISGWELLKTFAKTYGDRHDEFYYATNRQIFEYEDAVEALKYENGTLINDSDINLYVSLNGKKVIIPANSVYTIS